MKKLITALLKTKIGKAILALLLHRFLEHLKRRGETVHGGEGVTIVQFFHKLEPEFHTDFIDKQDADETHESIGHLEASLLEDADKRERTFLGKLFS